MQTSLSELPEVTHSHLAHWLEIFRITMAIFMSLTARGLSSINGDYFCYAAISSSGIVSILPGYLIRECSALRSTRLV
jgi:hypothetical protein